MELCNRSHQPSSVSLKWSRAGLYTICYQQRDDAKDCSVSAAHCKAGAPVLDCQYGSRRLGAAARGARPPYQLGPVPC